MDTVNKYMRFFGYIPVVIFFILGFLLLFSNYFLYIPLNYRIIFASIILLYSIFRLVTLFNKPKRIAENEEE
jgi:hypothetical protein